MFQCYKSVKILLYITAYKVKLINYTKLYHFDIFLLHFYTCCNDRCNVDRILNILDYRYLDILDANYYDQSQ